MLCTWCMELHPECRYSYQQYTYIEYWQRLGPCTSCSTGHLWHENALEPLTLWRSLVRLFVRLFDERRGEILRCRAIATQQNDNRSMNPMKSFNTGSTMILWGMIHTGLQDCIVL